MSSQNRKPSQFAATIRSNREMPHVLETFSDSRICVLCGCGASFVTNNISDILSGAVTVCEACQGRA